MKKFLRTLCVGFVATCMATASFANGQDVTLTSNRGVLITNAVQEKHLAYAEQDTTGILDVWNEFPIQIGSSATTLNGYNLLDGATVNGDDVVTYASKLYSFEYPLTTIRFVVKKTGGNGLTGDYPFFSLSSFEMFDEAGNEIELTEEMVTSNADHNALNPNMWDGQGVTGLIDDESGTYFHSTWGATVDDYHYLEVTLPKGEYCAFSFVMTARSANYLHQFPAELEIVHVSEAIDDKDQAIDAFKTSYEALRQLVETCSSIPMIPAVNEKVLAITDKVEGMPDTDTLSTLPVDTVIAYTVIMDETVAYAWAMDAKYNEWKELLYICYACQDNVTTASPEASAAFAAVVDVHSAYQWNMPATTTAEIDALILELDAARRAFAPIVISSPWVGTVLVDSIETYIYNTSAKAFLAAGNSWGTQASFTETGIEWLVSGEHGVYTIEGPISNGGNSHFFNGAWTDAATTDFVIEMVGENLFTVKVNDNYLAYDGTSIVSQVAEVNDSCYWQFVTKAERQAKYLTATATNPADATFEIAGANFGRNDGNNNAWVGAPALGGDNENFCAEKWNAGRSTVSQVISGMPIGRYRLDVQGFYRMGTIDAAAAARAAGTEVLYAKFFANGDSVAVMSVMEECDKLAEGDYYPGFGQAPNSMIEASHFFSAGYYEHSIDFVLFEGQSTITLGVTKTGSVDADWLIFDNFRLTYYGTDGLEDFEASKLEEYRREIESLMVYADSIDASGAILAAQEEFADATAFAEAALDAPTIESLTHAIASLEAAIMRIERSVAINAMLDGLDTNVPVDLTEFVVNPNMNNEISGWTVTSGWQCQRGSSYSGDGAFLDEFQEIWSRNSLGTASSIQTMIDMPNGIYRISADIIATSQYSGDQKGDVVGAYWMANDNRVDVATYNGVPENFSIEIEVMDTVITFGLIAEETTANWLAFDNVKLISVKRITIEDWLVKLQKSRDNFAAAINELDSLGLTEAKDLLMLQYEEANAMDESTIESVKAKILRINELRAACEAELDAYYRLAKQLAKLQTARADFAAAIANLESLNMTGIKDALQQQYEEVGDVDEGSIEAVKAEILRIEQLLDEYASGMNAYQRLAKLIADCEGYALQFPIEEFIAAIDEAKAVIENSMSTTEDFVEAYDALYDMCAEYVGLIRVHVDNPGMLYAMLLQQAGSFDVVERLEVSGTLNDNDLYCIRYDLWALKEIDMSAAEVTYLHNEQFAYHDELTDVVLPATLSRIGGNAFEGCHNLQSVTCPALAPPYVDYNFGEVVSNGLVTLYVPEWTITMYKLEERWDDFMIIEPIDNYYPERISVNQDFTLTIPETLPVGYKPELSIDWSDLLGKQSSLTVEGTSALALKKFGLGYDVEWETRCNGEYITHATLINHVEMSADSISIWVEITNDAWSFLSFPFDVKVADIMPTQPNTSYAIRKYSGKDRAEQNFGNTWQDMTVDSVLHAGEGYIWQSRSYDNYGYWQETSAFIVSAMDNEKKNQIFAHTDCVVALNEYIAESADDCSWNLIGNPYPSYYDTREMDFTAPITVWNMHYNSYYAYSPIDDEYILRPGEAFFVQCPTGTEAITFRADGRQADRVVRERATQAKAYARNADERQVFNLTLSNGEMDDRTRIVINPAAACDYEMNCDASKFMSSDARVPQLYTVNNGMKLAINERPLSDGVVSLGAYFGSKGSYTFALDTKVEGMSVVLVDKVTGMETDLMNTTYTFTAEAGAVDNRFAICLRAGEEGDATGCDALSGQVSVKAAGRQIVVTAPSVSPIEVYNADGHRIATATATSAVVDVEPGVYVVKVQAYVHKVVIK